MHRSNRLRYAARCTRWMARVGTRHDEAQQPAQPRAEDRDRVCAGQDGAVGDRVGQLAALDDPERKDQQNLRRPEIAHLVHPAEPGVHRAQARHDTLRAGSSNLAGFIDQQTTAEDREWLVPPASPFFRRTIIIILRSQAARFTWSADGLDVQLYEPGRPTTTDRPARWPADGARR